MRIETCQGFLCVLWVHIASFVVLTPWAFATNEPVCVGLRVRRVEMAMITEWGAGVEWY